jgi:hypothetical protein
MKAVQLIKNPILITYNFLILQLTYLILWSLVQIFNNIIDPPVSDAERHRYDESELKRLKCSPYCRQEGKRKGSLSALRHKVSFKLYKEKWSNGCRDSGLQRQP